MRRNEANDHGAFMRAMNIIKRDWKSLPNIMSYIRFLLIPVFVWLYLEKKAYFGAAIVIVISWLTDIVDGFVARKFNMITEFGKALDPLADKLTQFAIFLCLANRYKMVCYLLLILVVKEIILLVMGMLLFKREGLVSYAKWYGKITTGALEVTAIILVIVPNLGISIVNALCWICMALMLFSFFMYGHEIFLKIRKKK